MERKQFFHYASWMAIGLLFNKNALAMNTIKPEEFYFKDDGLIPNSKYPLLVYQQAFIQRDRQGGDWLEEKFASNNWRNSWRWGVYPFHHYHSNTHEVLGVFSGNALLHMGGEKGQKMQVKAGDILVIPAGVGHKCLSHSGDFTVLGAYPDGLSPDLKRGEKEERPEANKNLTLVKLPEADPLLGDKDGLRKLWSK